MPAGRCARVWEPIYLKKSDMDTDRDPIDLSALSLDPARGEHIVAAVLQKAGPELERRAAAGPLTWVARWAMPALPLAAMLAGLALAGVAAADRAVATEPIAAPIVEALGPPNPAYSWLAEARSPEAADLIRAMQEKESQ